jgi:hypothetical protein
MAKFISLSNIPIEERILAMTRLDRAILSLAPAFNDLPLFAEVADYRLKYKNLLAFAADLFAGLENKRELLLAVVTLIRAETSGRGDLLPTIYKAAKSVRRDLESLPLSDAPVKAELCDARDVHRFARGEVDLIITSPPYINVFNYHQNYRALLEVLGFDLLKVAQSEIGSNRKNRSNRYRTVAQYCLDMEQALTSFALSLKKGGKLVLVVGHQSLVRGVPFSNSQILRDVAESIGTFISEGERHRTFLNRFGESIREDILVLRHSGLLPKTGNARQIAGIHLERAMEIAEGDQRDEIIEALSDLPAIQSSPMLTRKGVL